MKNKRLLSGCFKGEVIKSESLLLDIDFALMVEELQKEIILFAHSQGYDYEPRYRFVRKKGRNPFDSTDMVEWYEESWDSEPTNERITLLPFSTIRWWGEQVLEESGFSTRYKHLIYFQEPSEWEILEEMYD